MNTTATLTTPVFEPDPALDRYDDELSVAEARDEYLRRYGLGDGGYEETWEFAWIGWFPVVILNTPGRKREIRAHDLHHVLTGMNARWYAGEIDVSAWEIAAGGCGRFLYGWAILLTMFALGLVVRPRAMFRAFLRGRGARNLFGTAVDQRIYGMRLGDLRMQIGLTKAVLPWRAADLVAFLGWSAIAVAAVLAPVGLLAAAMTTLG